MPSLKQITTKIKSVRSTRRIMGAMKLIAAVRLQKAQAALMAYRPYSDAYRDVVLNVAALSESEDHPLLRVPEEKTSLHVLFFTSDRGLCGSFNSTLIRNMQRYIEEQGEVFGNIKLSFVGRRGRDYFSKNGLAPGKYYTGVNEKNSRKFSEELAAALTEEFRAGESDEIVLAYNHFVSAISQRMTFERLLPLSAEESDGGAAESSSNYIFEPEKERIIGSILPKYVQVRIERAMNESLTSEHAARMTAMENATSNADEVIAKLTLLFNKTRQAIITTELMDIVNGTEAQKGGNE
ncbi:MAG: ATP synthase F1 subunit gamma [Candidatus Dadabacteria bacterium]|nr:ATP synthase F1 subunit gamma [Candidatus Dadabacteria bacterium]MYA48424.1 ATP synthase F1 subunit gamma [Candidatus Dadabacteria bacterium]MYG82283.1 ATP synthase F1 subunit gamma [Candidatus Dadabacteria bacterium]MYK48925.1 ATP synthase F1 subunit gamma [Candidatus Dadabacteria bacterium]